MSNDLVSMGHFIEALFFLIDVKFILFPKYRENTIKKKNQDNQELYSKCKEKKNHIILI